MRKEAPKVIIEFEPTPNFEEEFSSFVEEVLGWGEKENEEEKEK